jgi:hypothetical protein
MSASTSYGHTRAYVKDVPIAAVSRCSKAPDSITSSAWAKPTVFDANPNASTIMEDILDPPIGNEPHYCDQDIDGDRQPRADKCQREQRGLDADVEPDGIFARSRDISGLPGKAGGAP